MRFSRSWQPRQIRCTVHTGTALPECKWSKFRMRWEADGICCGADPDRTAGGARVIRSRTMRSVFRLWLEPARWTRGDELVHGLQGGCTRACICTFRVVSFANTEMHTMSSMFLQQSSGEESVNLVLVAGKEQLDGTKAWEIIQSALRRTQFCEFMVFPA